MDRRSVYRWLAALLCCCASLFSLNGAQFDDSILDMLPDGPVREEFAQLQKMEMVDRVFITIHADKTLDDSLVAEALAEGAAALSREMTASSLFSWVQAGVDMADMGKAYTLLIRHLPVLLDDSGRQQIAAMLTPARLHTALRDDFLLLNSPAGLGMREQIQRDPLGFFRFIGDKLRHLQTEFSVVPKNGFFFSADGRNVLLIAKSAVPATDTKQCEILRQALERMFAKTLPAGTEAEIVGALAHTLANSHAIRHDLYLLLPLASLLLLILLAGSLRDWRSLAVFTVPFLGAPPAVALTVLIYGKISIIALGFGIVILGIAVDFSIHIYLGLRRGGEENLRLLRRPLIFTACTTLGVLVVLFFSSVPCQRQMATLAFFGVLLGIFLAWFLIPTIVAPAAFPVRQWEGGKRKGVGRKALLLWGVLVASGFMLWPGLHYNGDMRALDVAAQTAEETRFNQRWKKAAADGLEQFFVIATGAEMEAALDSNDRLFSALTRQGMAGTVQTLAGLLPGEKKQRQRLEKWRLLWQRYPGFRNDFTSAAEANGFSAAAFAPFFAGLSANISVLRAETLAGSALFSSLLQNMLSQRTEGVYVLTVGRADPSQLAWLEEYCRDDSSVTLIANKSWKKEVERQLKDDILLLSSAAAGLVFILVLLQFRHLRSVVAVFAPVLSALAAIAVFCQVTGGELNMMHLLMAILVIGLSVDYGIFSVCMTGAATAMDATTIFALSICAASSLIGFGTLTFAAHPVLHAIGITVLVGIGASWPTALWITPAILGLRGKSH